MNIRFLILAGVMTFGAHAYSQTNPLRDKLDLVFSNVDKSQVPTGFLEEYGAHLLPLDVFNGLLTDSNKVNINLWRQIYATLQTSRIYGSNPITSLSTVNSQIESAETANPGVLPISMLYGEYNFIRNDAISLNLLNASNNQLYDVTGRTQLPYLARNVFAAAPTIGSFHSGTPSLVFVPALFYNVSNKTIGTIQVDFNDGRGFLSAAWSIPLAASYTTKGTKQIKIKVTFTDSSIAQCYTFIEIMDISGSQARFGSVADLIHSFPAVFQIHDGGSAFIKYSIINTTSPKRIRKPLIVVEGYDINRIAPKLQNQNYTFSDLIDGLNLIPVYDLSHNLDDAAGYDLIFLDFTNGSADIRRNAALLKEVISWVNTQKSGVTGNQPNVVLGISMGGLVARYALADLTKNGPDPQTRLLITHDSPHRGANTPLGLQALTRALNETSIAGTNISDLIPEVYQANLVLDAPATQQMLIVRALNGTGSYSNNSFLDNEYRSMVSFGSTGPQPAYKVEATSLGSQCGVQVLQPYTELFHVNGNADWYTLWLFSRIGAKTEITVNALPASGQSQRISKLKLWFDFDILFVIPVEVTIVDKSFYSPSTLLPWDGAPGGTRNVDQQVRSQIPSVNFSMFPFFAGLGSTIFSGDFSFVPTVSALDLTTINQNALTSKYVGGISPSNPTRVYNFVAHGPGSGSTTFNSAHPFFTARSAQWIYLEMESPNSNTVNCTSECTINYSPAISGGPACYGTPSAVGLSGNFPSNATFSWTTGPSGLFSTASGSGQLANLVVTNSTVHGLADITFTVQGLCQPLSLSSQFWVGPPAGLINGPSSVYPDQVYLYSADQMGSPYTFNWGISGPGYNWGWSYTQPQVFVFWSSSGTEGSVDLVSSNQCGTTSTSLTVFIETGGGCDPCQIVTPSPNPASKEFVVSIDDVGQKSKSGASRSFKVSLLNNSMQTVFESDTTETLIKIPVEKLPDGLYHLIVVNDEGNSTATHVQVVH